MFNLPYASDVVLNVAGISKAWCVAAVHWAIVSGHGLLACPPWTCLDSGPIYWLLAEKFADIEI